MGLAASFARRNARSRSVFLSRALASCSTMPRATAFVSAAFFSALAFVGLKKFPFVAAIGLSSVCNYPCRLPTAAFFLGAAINPSRCAFLRAILRARLMASAFSRTLFSEGFS